MTRSAIADSGSHRLAVVPGGGLIAGDRVALPPDAGGGPCLMSIQHDRGVTRAAVRAVELAEVPPGHMAVAEELVAGVGSCPKKNVRVVRPARFFPGSRESTQD